MNLSTFKNNLGANKSLFEVDDDADNDVDVKVFRGNFEGEEDTKHADEVFEKY